MKPTLLILIGCIAFACSPSINRPEKKCLDLTKLSVPGGSVKFEVNSPVYKEYKRHYLIQVWEDDTRQKLLDNVLLSRKSQFTKTIYPEKKNCIVVYKDQTLTTYKQMTWDTLKAGSVTKLEDIRKSYYASTRRGAFLLFAPPITSRDGSAGDGVRAVVN